jgi:serine/threonine-protein kinase
LTIGDAAQQRHLAITPDGSHLIYVGNRGTELFVRALDALEPVSVFARLPSAPFVSPDSQWIGFSDEGMLKKVPVNGGPAVPITRMDASTSRGATWGRNDEIIFATTNGATGLQQVSAGGGPTTVLTRADTEQGEDDHVWPEWLPGEQAVLFTITAASGGHEAAQVAVLDLKTRSRKVLLRGGSHAHYLPSGHLIYATAGTLRAVPFDLARLETRGPPVAAVRDVLTTAGGDLDAVVSANGTLAYVPGGVAAETAPTLVWVDRQGRETPIPSPPRAYSQPRLSPDGKRIAVFTADQDGDLWLSDLSRPTLTRLTSGAGADFSPVWTLDSRALIFSSQRSSAGNIFRQPANGSGVVERLSESPLLQTPTAITPDGRSLIFTETAEKTREDVMQMTLDGPRAVTPVVRTSFAERNGIVSPDGRWLAYEANDSGPFEIFVRPYPDVNSGLAKVSVAGGVRPLWAPSGRELFFVSPSGAIMGVRVLPGPAWTATAPTLLVKDGYRTSPGNPGRTYDISPDGQRFLMIKTSAAGGTAAAASLVVVQHWFEELKQRVPPP